jgi:hypothetical protein
MCIHADDRSADIGIFLASLNQSNFMKVVFVSHKSYPEFELYEENNKVMHIKIDNESNAFRITRDDNRRAFFIQEEVIKKNKIITLLNEYSQQLGSLTNISADKETGEMEIEGIQYLYMLNSGLSKEIKLFKADRDQSILTCKIEPGQLSFSTEDYLNYLLFGLAWYTFLTKEQANLVQLARV